MTDRQQSNRPGFSTRAIHAGQQPDPTTGAIMTPIYATSTYVQESPGVHKGYEYSRVRKIPTRMAYRRRCIADLESGTKGFAFASGLAGSATVLELMDSGSHVLAGNDLYGGTYRLFENVRKASANLDFDFLDMTDEAAIEAKIRPETRMIWVETPTNPLLTVIDLDMISRVARRHNLLAVADNTFATPWVQRPLEFGFDFVMHSATKYLNGHSDMVGGVIVAARDDERTSTERMAYLQNAVGGGRKVPLMQFSGLARPQDPGPADGASLRQCGSPWQPTLSSTTIPRSHRVYYPGLDSHPQHEGSGGSPDAWLPGGMVTAVLDSEVFDGKPSGSWNAVEIFALAESLGGVESLIEHPAIMTHASIPKEIRDEIGISDSLVRLSVGVEDGDDLIRELENALAAV